MRRYKSPGILLKPAFGWQLEINFLPLQQTDAKSDRLLRSADKVVLGEFIQRNKIGGEARDADYKVLVIVGLLLGLAQRLGTHDVELDLHATQRKIGLDELLQLFRALVTLNGCWSKTDIKLVPVGKRPVRQLGRASQVCSGTLLIKALSGGDSIGNRLAGLPAVGGCR